jgi:hypothetical protein
MTGKQAKIAKLAIRRHHDITPRLNAPEYCDWKVRNEALYRELWTGAPRRFDVVMAIIAGDQSRDKGVLAQMASRMTFRSSYAPYGGSR